MHEIGLVNEAAADFLVSIGDSPISKVVMAIGPDVDPEVAKQAWEIAIADSHVAGAELEFVDIEADMKCFDCEHEYQGSPIDACPNCGGNGLVMEEPEEVSIVSWEA